MPRFLTLQLLPLFHTHFFSLTHLYCWRSFLLCNYFFHTHYFSFTHLYCCICFLFRVYFQCFRTIFFFWFYVCSSVWKRLHAFPLPFNVLLFMVFSRFFELCLPLLFVTLHVSKCILILQVTKSCKMQWILWRKSST